MDGTGVDGTGVDGTDVDGTDVDGTGAAMTTISNVGALAAESVTVTGEPAARLGTDDGVPPVGGCATNCNADGKAPKLRATADDVPAMDRPPPAELPLARLPDGDDVDSDDDDDAAAIVALGIAAVMASPEPPSGIDGSVAGSRSSRFSRT